MTERRDSPASGSAAAEGRSGRGPRQVRLPGFVSDEPVGLGDAVKRATTLMGIKPCGGCLQRAAQLNRRVVFTGRRH